MQHSEDLIVVIDAQFRVQWASERITTMLGYGRSDAIGLSLIHI